MGKINYPEIGTIDFNDKYSKQDYTGKSLLNETDLEGIVIYGSCFSQETPDTDVFPMIVKKITFYNCNLDNVKIVKPGWIVIGGSERRYKVQNDLNDWLIDDTNKPTIPIDHKIFTKLGLPMPKPEDIPIAKVNDRIDLMEIAKGGII